MATAANWAYNQSPAGGVSGVYPSTIGMGSNGLTTNTEATCQVVQRTTGTLSRQQTEVQANDRGSSTMRSRKGGANGNQTATIGASTTGTFIDTTNTDTVSAADLWNHQITLGSGGTGFTARVLGMLFAADTNTTTRLNNRAATASATDLLYYALAGVATGVATENIRYMTFPVAGTLKNGAINVTANAHNQQTDCKVSINSATGNIVISFAASTTGYTEDTSNTDSISATNTGVWLSDFQGGSGSITVTLVVVDFLSTVSQWLHGGYAGLTVNSGSTTYVAPSGSPNGSSDGTESNVRCQANLVCTLSKIGGQISANTNTVGSTIKGFVGGSAGNQSASITALTTGHFMDSSNTDTISATTTTLSAEVVSGVGAGSIVVRTYEQLATAQSAGRTTKNTRAWPLGTEIGMGWRMPA